MKTVPVRGYEGLYHVNEAGEIHSLDRVVGYRIKGMTRTIRGRLIKPRRNTHGYYQCTLCKNGVARTHRVHRVVAESFYEPHEWKQHVAHLDGDRSNNTLSNLKFVTPSENEAHKALHGTKAVGTRNGKYTKPQCTPRGESHGQAKLRASDVVAIRVSNKPSRQLAKQYNISKTNVLDIKANRIWST